MYSQPAWSPESGGGYSQPAPEPGPPLTEDVKNAIAEMKKVQDRKNRKNFEKEKILARADAFDEAEAERNRLRRIVAVRGSSIAPKRVRWLWSPGDDSHGRIPLGELTLIVGRGGIGKSTLLAEFTAWITTGRMRGEFLEKPRDVLYVANEDSLEYTVTPRMIAAGADLDRVHFIGIDMVGRKEKIILPSDCDGLAEYCREVGAAAIMLDPLSSNMRAKANAGDEVRPVIEAVRGMAESAGVACVGLAHTRKAASSSLMDAIMGSSELGNVCRSVIGVMKDEDEDDGSVVLSQEKNNLGRTDIDSYRYRIQSATVWGEELVATSRLEWLGRTPMRVSEMMSESLASGPTVRGAVQECAEFIRDYLTPLGGQALKGEVQRAAQGEGYSRSTVDRAAGRLKLVSRPSGQGAKRLWCIPS